jgi:dipeptidyl aminopeptidase/acylaminoacyl peptidase
MGSHRHRREASVNSLDRRAFGASVIGRHSRARCATWITAALGLWLAGLAAHAADAPQTPSAIPAESFFDRPLISRPLISPNGTAVAMLVRNKAGRRQLAIVDTHDVHKVTIAVSFDDVDIDRVHWVDDQRLVFDTWKEDESAWGQKGSGLWAVDRTGANLRMLITANWEQQPAQTGTSIVSRALRPDHEFVRTLRDGTGDIVVAHITHGEAVGTRERYHVDVSGVIPLRLDTRTGHVAQIIAGQAPDHVYDWIIDEKGGILGAVAQSDGTDRLMVPEGSGWVERVAFAQFGESPGAFAFDEVGADGHVYVTRTTEQAGATSGLYRLDLVTGKTESRPVVEVKGFDYRGALVEDFGHHRLLGVNYVSDGPGAAWFDADLTALQKKIDAKLPNTTNEVDPAECGCAERVLVIASSDHQPPLFYLYDRKDDVLQPIGMERADIPARLMADTDFVRIKARDGEDLPVWVTKPKGKGPWPTVVLVHGGPQVRGWVWGWDAEFQYLASRGYLVVAPEYRGSQGYGFEHFRAGWKQWGLKMQDDIADATRWAASQGLADPARTCIAGASYGGYATLMGLVRYPDLYRCGVAWSAVTDINLMYDIWWSDFDDDWKGYGMPVLVGDKVKDAAQFDATSPLKQAAKITRPLLLAHGGVDHRVPIEHAKQLRDALLANHAPLTWVMYAEEAHGWYKPETRADWYRRMTTFLDAQIGPGAQAGAPLAQSRAASAP